MRARVFLDPRPDPFPERLVEPLALAQPNEQDDTRIRAELTGDILPHHDALDDLRKLLHLPVDLGRADAHATRVEGRVAPSIYDHPPARRYLGPVAVAP